MYGRRHKIFKRGYRVVLLTLALLTASAYAQMQVGDNVSMRLNGNVGVGYSGEFGDQSSGHGMYGTGSGELSGYYYQPNFLSFDVRPYYNRNQDNSSYTSILSDTGLEASADIFGGSHFPGSVAFSKAFIKGSQYGVPGLTGLNSDNSTRTFTVSWSELLPNMPTLTATFARNASSQTIIGED